jgi:cytochrome c6
MALLSRAAATSNVAPAARRRPTACAHSAAAAANHKTASATATATAAALIVAALASPLVAPAHATPDLALGANVFNGNCAACHTGGKNNVIPDRTLQKAAIEQYLTGGFSAEAIEYQVRNGKGAMPAWEGRLDDDEIEAVVAYVYDQAAGDKW